MLDKDKLILLFNIQIGGISDADISEYINTVSENLSDPFDNSVRCIFAPTRDESKPAVQAVTDFPSNGWEIILQMEKYLKENDVEEIKNCARALCEIARFNKKETKGISW